MAHVYAINASDFATTEHPLMHYGPSIRTLPNDELELAELLDEAGQHGAEMVVSDRQRVFDGVPEGIQYWAWNVMRKYMPEHDVYLRRVNKPVIRDPVRMPKQADLEMGMGKIKIPNEAQTAWEIEKWLDRQVKQMAQFYPSPKQNLALTTTEAY